MSGFSSIGRMAKLCLSSHVTEQTAAEDWVLLLRSSDLAFVLLLLVPVGFYSPVPVLWDVVADRDLEPVLKTSPVFHCECLAVDRGLSLEADCLVSVSSNMSSLRSECSLWAS